MTEPVLLGVRHHGPGSARGVRRVLSAYRPDVVLIEGPPEADPLVPLAGDEGMNAPVALLAYPAAGATRAVAKAAAGEPVPGRPPGTRQSGGRLPAAFWPFAEFSPEWQAIRWAVVNEVPVHFIDLPAAVRLALGDKADPEPGAPGEPVPGAPAEAAGVRTDPIGVLAAAAGYDDPERWWEDVIEHRRDAPPGPGFGPGFGPGQNGPPAEDAELAAALAPFEAIAEAMHEVRPHAPDPPDAERLDEQRREAAMRGGIRAAARRYQRIVVVCGAWHVPALARPLPPAAADARTLRGLPKIKTAVTWVPWTHARLASWQGYGAGVTSPGWYHHLFTVPDHPTARWLVRAAGVLRRDGLTVSSAHAIEATRLAEALATMRGRPVPGLAEVTDATRAVLCEGDEVRLHLVNRRLVVGDRLGRVPEHTPGVPIARDVAAAQRRLRLPPEPLARDIDLDLRRDIDLERSRLLYRLRLLGVEWGRSLPPRRGRGTFWESWRLGWQPEFAVDLVAASAYGTTVRDAAAERVAERAAAAASLADVTALVELCLLADLPAALPGVLRALDERVAVDHEVAHLMEALPALARTLRYGDVRGTDTSALRRVATGLVTRICIGLPRALGGLDEAAATAMRDRIDAVQASVGLLDDAGSTDRWYEVLGSLASREDLHGLLAGRLNRLVLDAGRLPAEEAGRRMGLVLTVGVPPARAAAWVEGFLAGEGLLLVHDERLLRLVDDWLAGIPADTFLEVLPLLRRTFSGYPAPQRRMIGERAARLGVPGERPTLAGADGAGSGGLDDDEAFDPERGAAVLATVERLLGWSGP